jgi:hypothetical protein
VSRFDASAVWAVWADLGWALAGAMAALVPALWMWGFTVDDALISVRYASHLASGVGYRFNAHGPSTDGVTPLPWAFLLVPLASADLLAMLGRAKALGLVLGALAFVGTGHAAGRVHAPIWARAATLAVLALSVPAAAYAVSGMETPLATLLATGAALRLERPRTCAFLAGLAVAMRPEMLPWAIAMALGACVASSVAVRTPTPRVALAVALAMVPFVLCAGVRVVVWGHPAPLALWAKPSDLAHGFAYAGAGCVVTLVPILVVAPFALRRSARGAVLAVAGLVHLAAIAVAGGDWMPYARLFVPILPSLALAAALAAEHAVAWATGARCAIALGVGAILIARGGTSGRSVGADRAALVREAGPVLGPLARVASLDVGWVGAATDADLIDLAGVTDPVIATLPGGHTSKRVPATLILAHDPDALVLYTPYGLPGGALDAYCGATYSRAIEARLAADDVIARHFVPSAFLPLGASGAGYVVLLRR